LPLVDAWDLPEAAERSGVKADELARFVELGILTPHDDGRFSAVVCFTMLHHVDSPARQDELFAQAHRVLRPGGIFAGSDSTATEGRRAFHADDTYVPIDPAVLPERLRSAGFTDVKVAVPDPEFLTFVART
jgi:SAM-dependent methyltransferase